MTRDALKPDKAGEGSVRMIVQSSDGSRSEDEDIDDENITSHSSNITSRSSNITNRSTNENLTNINSTDDTADKNITGKAVPENTSEKAEIAAYVYNDDNDELEVSLFIDSLPNGKVEVAKGSQETFGNYSLKLGFHRFKIAWKDPDADKDYESELEKEITGDDAVILYTEEHIEPDKFDLAVSVKNENDKETNAYLYIDKSYEKTQKLSEESTTEFEKVPVEEGVHDVSIRWLDPYTNAEYEKKKRVTVDDNKAVIFIATKGASFEDRGEAIETEAAEKSDPAETSSLEPSANAEVPRTATRNEVDDSDSTGSYNDTGTDGTEIDDTVTDDTGTNDTGIDNSTDNITSGSEDNVDTIEDGASTSDTNTANVAEVENENAVEKGLVKTDYLYAFRTLSAKESPTEENTKQKDEGWGNISFIYPLVLLAAAYLVFRH